MYEGKITWKQDIFEGKGKPTFIYEGKVTWEQDILRSGARLPLFMKGEGKVTWKEGKLRSGTGYPYVWGQDYLEGGHI